MKKVIFSLTVIIAIAFAACSYVNGIVPSKNYVTKKVEVGKFNGISTSSSIDVIYTQTSGNRDVEIYASDNLIPYIKVEVDGGVLKVGMKNNTSIISMNGSHKMEVRVSAPAVQLLKASSSGDIILKNGLNSNMNLILKASSSGDIKGGTISCNEMEASASSSGDISIDNVKAKYINTSCSSSGDVTLNNIQCENIDADASSSGDMKLIGYCSYANYKASSSGDINASNLKAKVVDASASSSGDIRCFASESVKGRKTSAGGIKVSGSPARIDISK